MRVSDLLRVKGEKVWSVQENQTINEAIEILVKQKIGALIVFREDKKVAGIISERDIVRECRKREKDVEFGARAAMSHVDGFLFLDKIHHDHFSESQTTVVREQVESYEKRFGTKPPSFTGDKAYGSRENREFIEEENQIRSSFARLGKKQPSRDKMARWFKREQKERNRIEGHFGHGKEHYGLDRMWYHGQRGSEIWTRGGILAMNLMTALARI